RSVDDTPHGALFLVYLRPALCLQLFPYTTLFRSARAYLEWYAQRNRPGARVLDYRPRPDLAAPFASLANTTPMQGGEMRSWVEGGELLIGYTVRGKPVREALSTVGFFIQTRMAGMGGGPGFEPLQGQTC